MLASVLRSVSTVMPPSILTASKVTLLRPMPHISTSARRNSDNSPYSRVGPPPLPPQEQKEWEELMRRMEQPAKSSIQTEKEVALQLHPDARRPLEPEFEGDVNPKTGEIGGPKKDPLNWGPTGEWTYGGRATDF